MMRPIQRAKLMRQAWLIRCSELRLENSDASIAKANAMESAARLLQDADFQRLFDLTNTGGQL